MKTYTPILLACSLFIAGCGSSNDSKSEDAAIGINESQLRELNEQFKTYQSHTNNEILNLKNALEQQIRQINDQLPVLNNQIQQQLQDHNVQVQQQIQKAYNDLQGHIKQLHGEIDQIKAAS